MPRTVRPCSQLPDWNRWRSRSSPAETPRPSALPAPSAEVRAEALARAARLADGLFPHQVAGVAFLHGRRRAILADDMELGKTRQSITALHEAAPQGPWLVVCPASVKANWARKIAAVNEADPVRIVGPGPVLKPDYNGRTDRDPSLPSVWPGRTRSLNGCQARLL
jgi:SNF2 family DNA or RNA helicase